MNKKQSLFTLLALAGGLLCGFFPIEGLSALTHLVTDNFLRFLKLLSLPLIFLSITSTLLNLKNLETAKRLFKKVFKYTLLTTLLSATLALLLFLIIQPAQSGIASPESGVSETGSQFLSHLSTIIPENPLRPFLENNVLAVTFMATILSLAILATTKEGKKPLMAPFFQELFGALLRMASYAIKLLPFAIFGFTLQFVEGLRDNSQELKNLGLYVICVIGANLIQGVVILPLLLKMKGHKPLKLAKAMSPALTTAFFSKSSSASLPVALECAENRAGISKETASFSFPLCSVINMNGCAAFILITTLFVAMQNGMHFSLLEMVPWIFLSSLAAIGNAGVPMGCYFLTSAFLVGMNVPLEKMGLILPLYAFIDMVETALNVWSDSSVTAIADKELNQSFAKIEGSSRIGPYGTESP